MGSGVVTPTAIVTGSASGIGLATVERAVDAGYRVVGIDVAPERPDEDAIVRSAGLIMHADVADPDVVRRAVDRAAEAGRISLVVSAAGILHEATLLDIEDDLVERALRVHVGGLFNLMHASVPSMRDRGGSVVAILSELVTVGAPEHAPYVAAKSAAAALVRTAARELAPVGIRVNGVAPGPVDTPLLGPSGRTDDYVASLPLGRLGRPEEIARVIVDITAWEWMTGAIVHVNGGAVIRT
jgi:NAD(P)-dependent dehydrogenase (short-subunit alcohol dehydrogenase family)